MLLREHHESYISWEQFERNQELLARNAYGKAGGAKSGRGGRALLVGLITCGRCGRRLNIVYTGKTPSPKYRADRSDCRHFRADEFYSVSSIRGGGGRRGGILVKTFSAAAGRL